MTASMEEGRRHRHSIHVAAHPSIRPQASGELEHGDPCTLVLFGGAGDLARRKLLGAVADLVRKGLLARQFTVVAIDREPLDDDTYRALVSRALDQSEEVRWLDDEARKDLLDRTFYVGGDLGDDAVYRTAAARLREMEVAGRVSANRLFYLAVPPRLFTVILDHLAASGLAHRTRSPADRPWVRAIVEKPFGHDLESALHLTEAVLSVFAEHQIYRIDHYLAKETVQNMTVFRAANAIFEPLWNRQHIAHVQITAAETVGVETRGGYYDHAGVVRDMFQNHLFQLLALTAMELPTSMRANAVRDEKVKVLRAVRPLLADGNGWAIRGRYTAGEIAGRAVPGYLEERGVDPSSRTPTYAAMRVMIDNGRWRGVPFYLRSGKRLGGRVTEIAVQFNVPPYLTEGMGGAKGLARPNALVFRIQPDEGITLTFDAKLPGAIHQLKPHLVLAPVDMTFDYADAFGSESHPAYETLLLDSMIGDATLFTRTDEVTAAWRLIDPLLDRWEQEPASALHTYQAGTAGPIAADEMLAQSGFRWRSLGWPDQRGL